MKKKSESNARYLPLSYFRSKNQLQEIKKQKQPTMLTFDEKGNLHPYEVIEMDLTAFERFFVENMEDREHRRRLFSKYLRFMEEYKSALGLSFFQWVNGSFTTTKPYPGDIDVVSFIDYDQFVRKLGILDRFYELGKKNYNVDAHFASTCKWNHRFHDRAVQDEAYWKNVFGFSRPDENEVRHPKGIIKIKF
ncbi:MAG: hypothetical protein AAB316_20115 [Bacteroidota bacterium]